MWKPKNLIDTLVPLYIVHIIFCHGIIQHPHVNKPKLYYSLLWSIVSTVSYCAFFLFIFYSTIDPSWFQEGNKVVYVVLIWAVFFTMNVNTVVSWMRKNEILTLNSQLLKSDDFLKSIGVSINIQREFITSIKFSIVWLIYSLFVNAVAILWFDKSRGYFVAILEVFTFHHGFHVNFVVDITFFMLIKHMRIRFQGVNKLLLDLFHLQTNTLSQKIKEDYKWAISTQTRLENDFVKIFRNIKRIHLELKIHCNEIMRIYGYSITLMVISLFFLILTQLFNLYVTMINPDEKFIDKIIYLSTMISWVLIASLKFFGINFICAETINEWNRTGEIIHKLEIDSEDLKFQKEVQKFSVQILQNPLKFSPCGLFDLSYYFIRDFAGGVAAQLIILIQTSHDSLSPQKH